MSYHFSTNCNRETDDYLSDEEMDNFSAEDTEDASETESQSNRFDEPIEIKEQMYQDKLANLKKQLEELKSFSHPEYIRRIKKLEYQYQERLRLNEIYRDYLLECVEKDYILEKNAAVKEYEEKKGDLKENQLADLEDKRKLIESERHTMELTDSIDSKPTITRKLRRRPNEPLPVQDQKRRKTPNGQLVLLLEDKDIDSDLKLISRGKSLISNLNSNSNSMRHSMSSSSQVYAPMNSSGGNQSMMMSANQSGHISSGENEQRLIDTKIEDGKLWYERRWFHRGQAVTVDGKDIPRFSSNITQIGLDSIWLKRINDGNKVRVFLKQLQTGKVSIKRRAN